MNELWKMQKEINDNVSTQFDLVIKQISTLIDIIEDHENDMEKMAEHINKLEKEISELKSNR